MICDIFTFNGEYDLLEIRLNILNDFVDQFIICEAPTTFSGKPKPLYYLQQEDRYAKWKDKIKYYPINENYSPEEIALAENSPNTKGAAHWKHEFLQKESIKKALTHLEDNDICFVGDVDEIWESSFEMKAILNILKNVKIMPTAKDRICKFGFRVYSYYLNNRSNEEFYGTILTLYRNVKMNCLNHLRTRPLIEYSILKDSGRHFTSMGGVAKVREKLNDSYTKESYNTDWVQAHLQENIEQSKDFLGRDFKYWKDENDWPQWLKINKQKYAHLCL